MTDQSQDSFTLQVNKQTVTRTSPTPDSDELARFREEWKAEVFQRTHPPHSHSQAPPHTSIINHDTPVFGAPRLAGPSHHPITLGSASKISPSVPRAQSTVPTPKQQKGLVIYSQAMKQEEQGNLDEALRLYQEAFRLDKNIDRIYLREELREGPKHEESQPTAHVVHNSPTIKPQSNPEPAPIHLSRNISEIIKQFPESLSFEPWDEDEGEPLLNLIPQEILVSILHLLDPCSLERFASVSRKARVITLEVSIWRDMVSKTYHPPQIKSTEDFPVIMERYSWEFRRTYVEHPRLRLDGVYIALNQYVRNGESDNQWVNVSHLITYYRYLRFFPNGQVLSLLVQGEEYTPVQIIPMLKPGLRMKDLSIGKWTLTGNEVQILDLVDASGKFRLPPGFVDPLSASSNVFPFLRPHEDRGEAPNELRYAFAMTLELKSKPVIGRWNRLDMLSYESVNLENGDSVPVSLGKERPFWFSKVKSYV